MRISVFFFIGSMLLFSCKNKEKAAPFSAKNIDLSIVAKKYQDTTPKKPILILDAGHGGDDPGAVNINDTLKLYEKNITRAIVNQMLKLIDTNKIRVIQTRIGDQTTDRHLRIANANQYNPNLLVTVHINEIRDTTISGFEVSYADSIFNGVAPNGDTIKLFNPYKKLLIDYANIFTNKIASAFPKMIKRKVNVRKDDIWVIYAGHYPSILIEFGYIGNRSDVKYLTDKKSITTLAKALTNSIYNILIPTPPKVPKIKTKKRK